MHLNCIEWVRSRFIAIHSGLPTSKEAQRRLHSNSPLPNRTAAFSCSSGQALSLQFRLLLLRIWLLLQFRLLQFCLLLVFFLFFFISFFFSRSPAARHQFGGRREQQTGPLLQSKHSGHQRKA